MTTSTSMQRRVRRIGVVTVARSDYGIYRPVLREIAGRSNLCLKLIVAADHLAARGGMTVMEIEADGFEVSRRVPMSPSGDSALGVARAMAQGLAGFADAYQRLRPDILLVLGDRFEMHAAVSAAMPFRVPVAHIHGGELTEGAMDNQFRHAISKMSHLHFVATEACRRRLLNMGEEPWRVTVSGAPGLDNLKEIQPVSRREFMTSVNLPEEARFILVTFHPETLSNASPERHMTELIAALDKCGLAVVFTSPNVDTGHRIIERMIRASVRTNRAFRLVGNMGTKMYFSAMKHAECMAGNSSSGIIEAAAFRLPVVNAGDRQRGREHGKNVVDVPCGRTRIAAAIRLATGPEFKKRLRGLRNPYGDGHAAERIVNVLSAIQSNRRLVTKVFWNSAEG